MRKSIDYRLQIYVQHTNDHKTGGYLLSVELYFMPWILKALYDMPWGQESLAYYKSLICFRHELCICKEKTMCGSMQQFWRIGMHINSILLRLSSNLELASPKIVFCLKMLMFSKPFYSKCARYHNLTFGNSTSGRLNTNFFS